MSGRRTDSRRGPVRLVDADWWRGQDPESLRDRPEFRRATRNMILACLAASGIVDRLGPAVADTALVVGTGHGELDSTAAFLGELGKSGVARPLLFQSSLHNATLGFLARHFGLTGPTFTVSSRYFSGEGAIELAEALVADGTVPRALVIGVDSVLATLDGVIPSIYPNGVRPRDGAGAILLARDGEGPVLERVDCDPFPIEGAGIPADFYDADAVERLARAWRESAVAELVGPKPDRSRGRIVLQRSV